MQNPNPIRLAAKLYECRDAARTLLGEQYLARMAEYGATIRQVAAAKQCSDIKAAMLLAQSPDHSTGVGQVLCLAAAVELIEPSTGVVSNEIKGPGHDSK